jgi:tRNA-Thr(GGU) m(6)t(6)A37 methyltransferase TsaA
MFENREGERQLETDPATMPADAHVVFIGRIASPWTRREDCPKNMRAARETGLSATLTVDAPYRAGLAGLEGVSHVAILTWLHHAPRNLIVQKPRHATHAKGVFALRSPVRPNPVGLHVVRLIGIDMEAGRLDLEAIDVLDGTPVIDIKPYFASVDSVPDVVVERADR